MTTTLFPLSALRIITLEFILRDCSATRNRRGSPAPVLLRCCKPVRTNPLRVLSSGAMSRAYDSRCCMAVMTSAQVSGRGGRAKAKPRPRS